MNPDVVLICLQIGVYTDTVKSVYTVIKVIGLKVKLLIKPIWEFYFSKVAAIIYLFMIAKYCICLSLMVKVELNVMIVFILDVSVNYIHLIEKQKSL